MEQSKQCTFYDFTLPVKDGYKVESLIEILEKWCSDWVFQKERGEETGFEHFQGRLRLKERDRLLTLKKKMGLPDIHLSITSNENKHNYFYVLKNDTRIEGPWKHGQKIESKSIPCDIKMIENLYPFQQQVIDSAEIYEPRKVDVIYSPTGHKGRSAISRYLDVHGIGHLVPQLRNHKDFMAWIESRIRVEGKAKKLYIVDLDRATFFNKEKEMEFWSAIESLKNGYSYDIRYRATYHLFDPPRVWVMTNTLPNPKFLSPDRWRIWIVNDRKELQLYRLGHEDELGLLDRPPVQSPKLNVLSEFQKFVTQDNTSRLCEVD